MVLPEYAGGGLGRVLMQTVVKDLLKRGGIRALEAFGDTRAPPAARDRAQPGTAAACCRPTTCCGSGFKTHRPHPRYPRMRLDLQSAVTWRDEVESALERLLGAVRPARHPAAESPCAPGDGRRGSGRRRLSRWTAGRSAARVEPEHAGLGVELGVEVDPLHGDHDRLGDHVAERRVRRAGPRRRGW